MKILVDSDFLFGLVEKKDAHHSFCVKFAKEFHRKKAKFFCLNITLQETATVLSNKASQQTAVEFIKNFNSVIDTVIILDEDLEQKTWDIFLKQKRKRTSFVDCANLAAFRKYKFDKIASFDSFYPKEDKLK